MSQAEVRQNALDILRNVLRFEGELRDELTFGDIDMWLADFLELDFLLTQKFGRRLSTDHEVEKLKQNPKLYDMVTVIEYLDWVCRRVSTPAKAA